MLVNSVFYFYVFMQAKKYVLAEGDSIGNDNSVVDIHELMPVVMNETDYIPMFAFINYNSNTPIELEEIKPYLSVKLRTKFIDRESLPGEPGNLIIYKEVGLIKCTEDYF